MTADELRRKLAQRLAESRGLNPTKNGFDNATKPSARSIPFAPENAEIPLSNAQERMWFLHRLDPAASAYNVCVLWHLRGLLDARALQLSAERITHRHSIFRTVYQLDNQGNSRQKVLPQLAPEWHTQDLGSLSPQERTAQLTAIAQQASTAPFDLTCQSPLRLVLVRLDKLDHVLVMVGQHIVWDGPSFGIFSRELATGYNLFLKGHLHQDAPAPLQYVDFAHWHRRQWDSPSAQRSAELAFWKAQLSPLPEPIDFPKDFERSAGEDEAGEWCTESLDTQSTASLLALATQEHLTPFEVVIAAIALLLTRLSRASEVTIGTVASHRNLPELNHALGNFGNVVPLRFTVAGHKTFRDLVQHCAKTCRLAFAHADLPFEHLLDHLNIPRGATRNPLLDTMVTFLSHGMESPAMDGLEVQWKKHFNGTTQIDLSFDALLQAGSLQLQATWRKSLYRPGRVQAHLRRLAQLLEQCIARPDAPLIALDMLLPEERAQLVAWGSRAALPPDANTLVGCFENRVRQLPDAIALSSLQRSAGAAQTTPSGISFTALNARANRLARWLVAQGVGPEDAVAIALPRRPEWFVAMLAILKAGAAFVPIDPAYPADYIHRVIRLAQPSLTFVDAVDPGSPWGATKQSVSLAGAEQAAQLQGLADADLADSERRQPLQPAHPACIVFTSGSSGEPKGVVVPHSAFVNLFSSHCADLYREAQRRTGNRQLRIGHAWSLAFDAAWQPTLWMFAGHELHLFDVDIMQDPIALAREIILRRLDFIELTPGMLDEVLPWLQSGLTDASGQHLPAHVPAILAFGGESVKQALWERILKLENTTGFNLYGPTEACVDSMIAKAKAGDPPTIGGPIAGAQVYVLDACLQLAPPGVAGELAIAGSGLARGYLQRGDLTAKQFIANPHGLPGSRLYLTGDRVRWLPGGILEYIGRIDEQVKIRGFRVEPLEVEASVEQLVQRPCAVVARKNKAGTLHLLCFVETGSGESAPDKSHPVPEPDVLLQLFARNLPAHLLPKFVIPIAKLPRLPNGKINRRALVMPEAMESAAGRLPRNPLEHKLCTLMAGVLGREQVSIDDGFFELGGDSISVIKLVSLARRDGLSVTARQIFDAGSVARLAPLIDHPEAGETPPAHQHDLADTGPARPTALMARYLSLGVPLQRFAQVVSIPLPEGISDAELQALLTALVERHALLRARLVRNADAAPGLEIPPLAESAQLRLHQAPWLTGAITAKPGTSTKADTSAKLARHLCEQLNPAQGIMLAALRTGSEQGTQSALWLAISHLVMDASSWHILASDLALGRQAQTHNQPIELPPVATAWRTWSAGLAAAPAPRPARSHGTLASATRMTWVLPPRAGQCPVARIARRLGLPLANLLPALAALAVMRAGLVPGQYAQTLRLAVEHQGREASGPNQDLSRTIGWFARETSLLFSAPDPLLEDPESLARLLHQWSAALAGIDRQTDATESHTASDWQLGFNFLGDFGAPATEAYWVPQPRMEVLPEACGDHWPLLHNLDMSAHYAYRGGQRLLTFDALGPGAELNDAALKRLFTQLHALIDRLTGSERAGADNQPPVSPGINNQALQEVTPLQYEMLRHCKGQTDPWTTQMELALVATPAVPITADSLRASAAQLLARHQALRAGFLPDQAATFIPQALALDWQSLDWQDKSTAEQEQLLSQVREQWYQHRFQLDRPPLLRFMAIQLPEQHWLLLVNSHHLLLDGWSVPRVLSEWLGGATGVTPKDTPQLDWSRYLGWLETQDRSAAQRYWDQSLQGLRAPALLRPSRQGRHPSLDLRATLTPQQSQILAGSVRAAGVSSASLYQLAWAKTLAVALDQTDVVFGMFDSGRAAPIDGLASLVGLVTQLVPLRLDTASSRPVAGQLRELQARQFEWQTQPPVRLDNLDAARRFGEFFDTLLVIENALDAEAKLGASSSDQAAPSHNPLSLLRDQRWRDSIGQVAGLFVYPGTPVALRLCYDPEALTPKDASDLLALFKYQLQQLVDELAPDARAAAPIQAPETTYTPSGD